MSPADDANEDAEQRPSKSARKRAAHAAQDLGEELIRLPDDALDALGLPEELTAAVREARRIASRAGGAGLARQRQYIGKLMRGLDATPIRAALAARGAVSAHEAERFRRVEAWRERLLGAEPSALTELAREYPRIDLTEWARRIAAARDERARGGHTGAARELFRALRALLDTMP